MSYFEKTSIQASDSPSIDAFARWRTSSPHTLFDSKLIFSGSVTQYWSTRLWENSTSSYDPYDSKLSLTVGTESGSRVVDQTKQYFIYEPGKSLTVVMTGVFGQDEPGVMKYMMYGKDTHGLGFCQSGSSFGVIKRDTAIGDITTTTFVSQSEWNLDKFDGNGPSGKLLDNNFAQIYFTDMEWLGVGRVRYGIFQGGIPYYVHEFDHINELSTTYMGNPNLPVRYEIVNMIGSVNTSSMKHICCSVISEGGTDSLGVIRSVDQGNTSITIGGNSHCAVLFLRHSTGSANDAHRGNSSRISPLGIDVLHTGNTPMRWATLLNPTVTNFETLSWLPAGKFGAEYAVGSATTTVSDQGEVLVSGYMPESTNQAKSTGVDANLDPFFAIGEDLYGNRDFIAISVWNLSATSTPVYSSLNFREII